MSGHLYEVTGMGNIVSPEMAAAVDHLLKMHSKMSKWDFIEELMRIWRKRNPVMWESYTSTYENRRVRGELTNAKTGESRGGLFRKIIDLPHELFLLFDFFYPEEFSDADARKKFLYEFANKYPMFKVPEGRL